MACLQLDLCNYLESADEVRSPITGFGPYKKRSSRCKEYQKLLFEQESQIEKLKKQRKKLKKRIKKLKQKKEVVMSKGELSPKDRDYIIQLENTIASAS